MKEQRYPSVIKKLAIKHPPMRTRIAPINQKKELARALKPYRYYNKWIKSKGCFLSWKEIGLVSLYKQTGSYSVCAGLLQISLIEAANRLIKTVLRLNTWLPLYQEWEKREITYYKNLARQAKLLNQAQSPVTQKDVPMSPP